jgi:hypothetical protein
MHARVYRCSVLSADPKIAALAAETGGKSETPQMPDQLSDAFIDHGRTPAHPGRASAGPSFDAEHTPSCLVLRESNRPRLHASSEEGGFFAERI